MMEEKEEKKKGKKKKRRRNNVHGFASSLVSKCDIGRSPQAVPSKSRQLWFLLKFFIFKPCHETF